MLGGCAPGFVPPTPRGALCRLHDDSNSLVEYGYRTIDRPRYQCARQQTNEHYTNPTGHLQQEASKISLFCIKTLLTTWLLRKNVCATSSGTLCHLFLLVMKSQSGITNPIWQTRKGRSRAQRSTTKGRLTVPYVSLVLSFPGFEHVLLHRTDMS